MRSAVRGDPAARGAFAADGDRWTFSGRLTFDDATAVLDASSKLPLPAAGVVDLRRLDHADSSALAVLLEIKRRAASEGRPLAFVALPPTVVSLARVYGIDELLAA